MKNDNPTKDRGIEQTWEFAHPNNKKFTGPLDKFQIMLKGKSYSMLLNHKDHKIKEVFLSDKVATFEVIILDNNKEMLFSTADNLDIIKIKDISLKGSPEIAKVNNSYFLISQISVKEFMNKLIIENCKFKFFRETLFVFDLEVIIRVIDKLNRPFIKIPLNKLVCSQIEPYGRHRSISKKEIRRLRKGPE